jgi:serine-type D-Ala-D-Ala carboxypeptidase/endopeptidase
MDRRLRFSFLVGFFLSACASPSNKTTVRDLSSDIYAIDDLAARLRETIVPQIGSDKNVGAIVGIYSRGEIRFLSFGEIKKGASVPPNNHTVFEIGSLTKTFTGLMMAEGVEKGAIHESDRLDSFNQEWSGGRTGDISLLDLVTHRSGLPRLPCNLHYADPRRPYADYDETDLIRGLNDDAFSAKCPLSAHPSAEITYSNWGFGLLGYLMSKKASLTYPALLKTQITEPFGLTDTSVDLSADQKSRLAQGYDETVQETALWDRKVLFGNGAIRSTASDILKYAQFYLHPETSPNPNAIRRSMRLRFQSPTQRIAYAWNVTPSGSIWHSGMTGGFASELKVYPTRDLAVLYLTNTAKEIRCFIESVEAIPCNPLGP